MTGMSKNAANESLGFTQTRIASVPINLIKEITTSSGP